MEAANKRQQMRAPELVILVAQIGLRARGFGPRIRVLRVNGSGRRSRSGRGRAIQFDLGLGLGFAGAGSRCRLLLLLLLQLEVRSELGAVTHLTREIIRSSAHRKRGQHTQHNS
jgi:hypothetical protein